MSETAVATDLNIPSLDDLLEAGDVTLEFDVVTPRSKAAATGKRAEKEAAFQALAEKFRPIVDQAFGNPGQLIVPKATITSRALAKKLGDHFGTGFETVDLQTVNEETGESTSEQLQLRLAVGVQRVGVTRGTKTIKSEDGTSFETEVDVPVYQLTFLATDEPIKERKPRAEVSEESDEETPKARGRKRASA